MNTEEEIAAQLNTKLAAKAAADPQAMLRVGGPMPVAMGRCADLYHDVRELRLSMEKEVAEVKAREAEIEEHIIQNLSKSEDTGAAGLRYRAQVVVKKKPRLAPEGWGIFCSWVRKNDRFDMIQKRLSEPAVMEWNEIEARILPGTEIFNAVTLSVTKV